MKTDISNREDIRILLRRFYDSLLSKEEFSYIFLDVAQLNISDHLEILVDFWEGLLFSKGGYARNAMKVHMDLHYKHPLTDDLFAKWLSIYYATVDDLFEGTKADEAKKKAKSIAEVMKMKIDNLGSHHSLQ